MTDAYRTVADRSDVCFEVDGSEFIGYVFPAETAEKTEVFVIKIEERHPDATRNVPAYRTPTGSASSLVPGEGSVMLCEYQNDDGELSSSLGKPALNVLVQQGARSVTAVVTRYYGGTNLDIGGLVCVYSRTVKEAFDAMGVVKEIPYERFTVTVEYDGSGSVRGLLESAGVEFEVAYEADVPLEVYVLIEDDPGLRDRIWSAIGGHTDIE